MVNMIKQGVWGRVIRHQSFFADYYQNILQMVLFRNHLLVSLFGFYDIF